MQFQLVIICKVVIYCKILPNIKNVQNKTHSIMSFTERFCYWSRKAFKKFDLFPTSNFMRYNGDSQYTTATGGFVSIVVIIVFAVMFASMALKTIDRKIITSSVQKIVDSQPPAVRIKTRRQNNFMFAVSLIGFDLSNPFQKLFNITLAQTYYGPGYSLINQTMVPLQPCKPQHVDFGKDIQDLYYKFNMTRSLCPPLGYEFNVGGKPTSNVSSVFGITVDKCDASVDPHCMNSTAFNNIQNMVQQFTLVVPVVNVQLNPGSTDYKSYYLQDRNHFKFDSHLGNNAFAYLQQIVVNTDVSIMPYADIQSESFTVLPQAFTNVPYYKNPKRAYAQIMFSKGASTTTYNRSFNKIDSYFSYVGGLVGTIIGLIFIMNIYTEKAYEISISHKLFKDGEGKEINSNSFNFLYFIAMIVKDFFSCFCCKSSWPKTQKFMECCQEMNFQLDICYILKKIMFLQTAVNILFKQQQISTLYLHEKQPIEVAKQKRRKYFGTRILNNQSLVKIHAENQKIANNQSDGQSVIQRELSAQQKSSQIVQNVQDFSAISFTRRSKDAQDYQKNLQKVLRDVLEGDQVSRRIVERLDSRFYSKKGKGYENQNEQAYQPKLVFQEEQNRGIQNIKQAKIQGATLQNFDFQI